MGIGARRGKGYTDCGCGEEIESRENDIYKLANKDLVGIKDMGSMSVSWFIQRRS